MPVIKQYLLNLFIAVDQLFNTLFGGDPDETISSRCGKIGGFWERTVNMIMFWDHNHCDECKEEDEGENAVWKVEED